MDEGEMNEGKVKVVDVNERLIDIQNSVTQLHDYCLDHNPGGGREYMLLMQLNSFAGSGDHEPISQEKAIKILESVRERIVFLKNSSEVDEESLLSQTLNQVNECLNETAVVFGLEEPKVKRERINRRTFLKRGGVTVAAVALAAFGIQANNHLDTLSDEQLATESQFRNNVLFLKKIYGIDIYTNIKLKDTLRIYGESPSQQELELYVQNIKDMCCFYPKDFFIDNGIHGISILKNMKTKKSGDREVGGIAIVDEGYLCMSVSDKEPTDIHHEIYHMTDLRRSFLQKITLNNPKEQKKQMWEEIFECNCDPYNGGVEADKFVSNYAKTDDREDRAETAQYLMNPTLHKQLLDKIESVKDPEVKRVLTEKINTIKMDYFTWSRAKMDGNYWQDLLEGKIDEDYWLVGLGVSRGGLG